VPPVACGPEPQPRKVMSAARIRAVAAPTVRCVMTSIVPDVVAGAMGVESAETPVKRSVAAEVMETDARPGRLSGQQQGQP